MSTVNHTLAYSCIWQSLGKASGVCVWGVVWQRLPSFGFYLGLGAVKYDLFGICPTFWFISYGQGFLLPPPCLPVYILQTLTDRTAGLCMEQSDVRVSGETGLPTRCRGSGRPAVALLPLEWHQQEKAGKTKDGFLIRGVRTSQPGEPSVLASEFFHIGPERTPGRGRRGGKAGSRERMGLGL